MKSNAYLCLPVPTLVRHRIVVGIVEGLSIYKGQAPSLPCFGGIGRTARRRLRVVSAGSTMAEE